MLAGVITLAGLSLMVVQGEAVSGGSVRAGVLWGLLSALLFALRNLLQKYHFKQVASDSLMFHQVVTVTLMLLLFVDYPRVLTLSGGGVLKIVLLGVFSTAAAHTLLTSSLKQLPAKSVALISCLQPVIAAFLAWYVIHEVPGSAVLFGGGIVLAVAAYESVQRRPTL
jgi:drug/metabolite transporter (DMT)-like permease